MKKVIAAAAGLMLAGTMVSTAVAGVEFSGDARARYYYQNDYDFGMNTKLGLAQNAEDADHWNSRVRLKVKGTTAGGSYAVVKTRIGSHTWGQVGTMGDADTGAGMEVFEAYVAVPMGCTLLSAGRQQLSLTNGFWNDTYVDNARVTWSSEGTTFVGLYGILKSEVSEGAVAGGVKYNDDGTVKNLGVAQDATQGTGQYNDSEDRIYVLGWMQQWDDVWSSTLGMSYTQLDLTATPAGVLARDNAGLIVNAAVAGQAGPVALTAEFGYQEDGFTASDDMEGLSQVTGDDGWGGYVTAGMDFDAVNVTFVGGAALDGYAFDAPVGFVMIGGDSQIVPGLLNNLGNINIADDDDLAGSSYAADTWFAGFKTSYQLSEALGLGFNLAYANVEITEANSAAAVRALIGDDSTSAFEISATAAYAINDGTTLKAQAGYLDVDKLDDPAFGLGLSLELAF